MSAVITLGQTVQEWHAQTRGVIVMCMLVLGMLAFLIWWLRR